MQSEMGAKMDFTGVDHTRAAHLNEDHVLCSTG